MNKVRFGVIGAGWWASFAHIPALRKHAGVELRALQKGDHARARKMADDFGVPQAYDSADELVAKADVDAVVVSSTPNMHYRHAKLVLDAGKHLLIEKPMTLRVHEARELIDLARRRSLHVIVSCPWHYTRHGQAARAWIRSGRLGRVKMISILMTNPVDRLLRGLDTSATYGTETYIAPRPGSYSDPSVAGGGQIYCQASHTAAYLTFLTDQLPKNVFAHFDYDGSPNDIYDTLNVQMDGGTLVSLATTGATPKGVMHYEVRIYGSEGVLAMDLWQGKCKLHGMDGREESLDDLTPEEVYPAQAPAANLADILLGRGENQSPGFLGVAAMEVIEAACESAKTGQNVCIPGRGGG